MGAREQISDFSVSGNVIPLQCKCAYISWWKGRRYRYFSSFCAITICVGPRHYSQTFDRHRIPDPIHWAGTSCQAFNHARPCSFHAPPAPKKVILLPIKELAASLGAACCEDSCSLATALHGVQATLSVSFALRHSRVWTRKPNATVTQAGTSHHYKRLDVLCTKTHILREHLF